MNEFDLKAAEWDQNPMHWDRSVAIVSSLQERIPLTTQMSALEFGAGTGIASFLLKDKLKDITMMDNSLEMVKIMNEKILSNKPENLEAVNFDLENNIWTGKKFDLIMTQMVLHHVVDIDNIIGKFYNILNPEGYLAIADLYAEDGSFHGEGFTGHKGFDLTNLSRRLKEKGFKNISHSRCFVIKKKVGENVFRDFDIFLLTASC